MPSLSRLRRLSVHDLRLLSRALGAVVKVRGYLRRHRHADLRRFIDAHAADHVGPVPRGALTEVAWSVRNAARLVPGATCLTQACAGQLLLAQRGYPSTVRISVPPRAAAGDALAPHAWLMADEIIILGGSSEEYARHRMLHDYALPMRAPAA